MHFLLQGERTQTRFGGAVGVSLVLHVVTIAFAMFLAARSFVETRNSLISDTFNDLVWLDIPGPGGGGGGGGNRVPEPPRKAELPGKDKISVPVVEPLEVQPPQPEEPPPPQLNIPAQTLASAPNLTVPGALEGLPSNSQGSGSNGGAGTGSGSGIGQGQGSGLGPGTGGGTGGGAYRPGSGIELPKLLREVKPQYTAEAMRAKVQGTVLLECVVQSDGTVGRIDVVRSLDRTFGLDQEAIKAVGQWRFAPGTRQGQPVAVLVTVELTFTLR